MLCCEFDVPISPTPDFLCRVHYLAESIANFSGLRSNERCPWTGRDPFEWRWVALAEFTRWSYAATAFQRYCYDYAA